MTYLVLIYIATIVFPVIYSLNEAVNTVQLVDEGCKQKLQLLDLDVEILAKNTQDLIKMEAYASFREELKSTIELVDRFKIPKYKFLWTIEISPTIKNTIILFLTSSLTGFGISVLLSVKETGIEMT